MIEESSMQDILRNNIFVDQWGSLGFDPDEEWSTDDLIELGVLINKILRER